MFHKTKSLAHTAMALTIGAGAAHAQEAEVIHFWTSGGESAAISVIAEAFEERGGNWVDNAIAGGSAARGAAINRIIGGDPSTAALFNTSQQYHEIIGEGLLNDIDGVANRNDWDNVLPAPIVDAIKVDGKYYAAPVNIHMPLWLWYSSDALQEAGIESPPETMEEFFAALDALQEAGITPLALGGQRWQENLLFSAMMTNVGGHDLWTSVYADKDEAAINSPEFREVIETFIRLKQYVDDASPGRNWNDTTAMLISDEAGFQFMGDWAKGEFKQADQEIGVDYGCLPGLRADSPYVLGGDVFVFPRTDDPAQIEAQTMLVETITAPDVQVSFNNLKGSIPIRSDVDATALDECAALGMEILSDPSRQAPDASQMMEEYVYGSVQDIITELWNTDMSVDEAVSRFDSALRN
ncbi:ABC transporter substrate-binding protein [Roseivivax sediminis]|uniref:Probable sugar-binding periplasmic protein n=1 Tax=Roseivivax sediminis TaxID=936889 RepID=A0A1I1SZX8_9RHOB|nr:ABC transporter substrate-binding protein [Roseivivax sediminis]SFD51989.1 carbohydrate ABC transporter substrate-binding protein, CUT1 family [Roseivivax sediminis]